MINTIDEPGTATGERRRSWRDHLSIHPAALLFPPMTPDELKALAADIQANGLRNPIILWVPGSPDDEPEPPPLLLDGVNRLDGLELAGRVLVDGDDPSDPFTSFFYGCVRHKFATECDPYAFVLSANLHRRHLSAEQKRDLIAKLLKAQPEKSDRQIAATVKASPTTVGAVRTEMEATGDVSNLDTRTDSQGRQQPAHKPPPKTADSMATQPAPTAPVPTRDDIGPDSRGEVERLKARIDELHRLLALRDQRIAALERRVRELIRQHDDRQHDDGGGVPEFLRRAPP